MLYTLTANDEHTQNLTLMVNDEHTQNLEEVVLYCSVWLFFAIVSSTPNI